MSDTTSGTTYASQVVDDWKALDPCPLCGARPHDAPEGVNPVGEPHFVFPHCFKCGYRPGRADQPVPTDALRQQFEAFQRFMAQTTADDMQHPTLQPPASDEEADALRARLAEVEADLARYRTDTTGVDPNREPSIPPANPGVGS